MTTLTLCFATTLICSYLDLPFAHDLVHNLVVILVELAFIVTVLIAQDPQVL